MSPHPTTCLWEFPTPYEAIGRVFDRLVVKKQTQYQELIIVDTPQYGRMLVLDGVCQSSTSDEFLYHEPLVQIPMILHGKPQTVLILGGGEGATMREALRWKTVQKVVMVDIDAEVVKACKEHMPQLHQGSFDDPRSEVIIDDALKYVRKARACFDVIISDLTDPTDGGLAEKLYSPEFYRMVKRILNRGGVFVTHTGLVAPSVTTGFGKVWNGLGRAFKYRIPYLSYVPSFLCAMGFIVASDRNLQPPPAAEIDNLLKETVSGELRMLDGAVVSGLLATPKWLKAVTEPSRKSKKLTAN